MVSGPSPGCADPSRWRGRGVRGSIFRIWLARGGAAEADAKGDEGAEEADFSPEESEPGQAVGCDPQLTGPDVSVLHMELLAEILTVACRARPQ